MNAARRLLTVSTFLAALGLVSVTVSVATARGAASPAQSTCPVATLSRPFAAWGDEGQYQLVPGGDFESGAWTLADGAQRVPGSEPYAATGAFGAWAASVPAGSTATSPQMCLDSADRAVRFFITGSGSVLVSVIDGGVVIPLGIAAAHGPWQPGPALATGARLLGPLAGGAAEVALRVTGLAGQPIVDDVFLDPWNRG